MSKSIENCILGGAIIENCREDKQNVIDILTNYGKPFYYYDTAGNRFDCNTSEEKNIFFNYLKKENVEIFSLPCPIYYKIPLKNANYYLRFTIIEDNEDKYFLLDPTIQYLE